MIPALTNHLWQSTVFVLAAALVATALRQNSAHVRHRIWLVASLKFLLPLSVLMSIGGALPRIAPAMPVTDSTTVSDLSITVDRIAQPFMSDPITQTLTTGQAGTSWITVAVIGLWACGFGAVVLMRLHGWRRVRAALRASTPVPVVAPMPVRSSPGLLEPGVVGLWRPVLLVPAGIEQQLTARQFESVLLHEWCHIQRRDNLTSAIHMVVEAVFWFHPLVWFVGARLVDERERACDEYVLEVSGDPEAYAESILNVCKLYVESPVACVSGVTGADLKKRIAAIMINHVGLQLSVARKAGLMAAAVLAVTLPVAAGIVIAPIRASSSALQNNSAVATYPKFDVVSVKPCEPNAPGQSRGGRGGAGSPITSPGRLYLQCYPLISLFKEAYISFADGRGHAMTAALDVDVEGVPDWMTSERFLIEAKTEQVVPAAVMRGPMLQAVLEDRFKLKIRRVTREMPIYELVTVKSGAKVSPYTGQDCVIRDNAVWPPAALPEGQRYCGDRSRVAGDLFIREGVMTLGEFASLMGFDRPVVNRTGITAPVSYRVEFVKDDWGFGGGGEAPRASWLSALRNQLGLDLREGKGPRDFLVIDHVERPTPDPPSPDAPFTRGFGEASSWPSLAEGPSRAGQVASRFDVVSIKPCPKDPPPPGPAAPAGFRRGGAPWHPTVSPGYAFWSCATLAQLVDQAYADQDHPLLNIIANPRQDFMNQPKRVRGGPSWVETEKFTIEAKAPVATTGNAGRVLPTLPAAMGHALRAVLEDRFKVQVRRATEEQSMFALTIAKGGVNAQQVTTPVSGDCMTTAEYAAAVSAGDAPRLDALRLCGQAYSGRDGVMTFSSFTFQQLAGQLSNMMDHYVLDRTGVGSKLNFSIKPEPHVSRADVSLRFSRALEGLGLKLEPTKGPAEYLVIDRAERPTPDPPSPDASFSRGFGGASPVSR